MQCDRGTLIKEATPDTTSVEGLTNLDVFKKKAYIFINNIIEKAIMALGLENKI